MMPEWMTVAKTEDLPEGEMIGATVDGLAVPGTAASSASKPVRWRRRRRRTPSRFTK